MCFSGNSKYGTGSGSSQTGLWVNQLLGSGSSFSFVSCISGLVWTGLGFVSLSSWVWFFWWQAVCVIASLYLCRTQCMRTRVCACRPWGVWNVSWQIRVIQETGPCLLRRWLLPVFALPPQKKEHDRHKGLPLHVKLTHTHNAHTVLFL